MADSMLRLAIAIFVSQLAGIIGSIFTFESVGSWYAGLSKPFFNPPSWVFGPVWISLYTLMGIAVYLVWRSNGNAKEKKTAYILFGAQLALNTLWSILFFGAQMPWLAFVEIIVLWGAIAFTMKKFLEINRNAGYLLLPYIAWVSFAAILNLAIALLN